MPRVGVNGLSIAYERAGDGPALVLLHGFSLDSRSWRPQVEGLSDIFTVVAWDAPGAGKSQDPPDSFGIGDWADALAGMLDAAGVRQHTSSDFRGADCSLRSSIGVTRPVYSRLFWLTPTPDGQARSRQPSRSNAFRRP